MGEVTGEGWYNDYMCRVWPVIISLACLPWAVPQVAAANPRPYVLRGQHFYKGQDIDHTVLRLYPRHGKKPVWTYTVTDIEDLTWSPNGRAFVSWFMDPTRENRDSFDMLIWREGHRPRVFYSRKFYQNDYLWDFQWSPDGRRVAFLMGGSGSKDVDDGELLIYDCVRNRLIRSAKIWAARMRWANSRTLRYWPRGFREHGNEGSTFIEKPRLWRIGPL